MSYQERKQLKVKAADLVGCDAALPVIDILWRIKDRCRVSFDMPTSKRDAFVLLKTMFIARPPRLYNA